jgi:hypothetical protein
MANANAKILQELIKREGNSECADCRKNGEEILAFLYKLRFIFLAIQSIDILIIFCYEFNSYH